MNLEEHTVLLGNIFLLRTEFLDYCTKIMGCAAAPSPQTSPERSQVESWLRDELSMPQYIDGFIDNGYDRFDAVYGMGESDLKSIGVKAGHIKVIVKAIQDLQQSQSGKAAPPTYQDAPPSYGEGP